jgi:hypothetical protein
MPQEVSQTSRGMDLNSQSLNSIQTAVCVVNSKSEENHYFFPRDIYAELCKSLYTLFRH